MPELLRLKVGYYLSVPDPRRIGLRKETNVYVLEIYIQDITIHRYAKVISSRTDRHDESSVKIADN